MPFITVAQVIASLCPLISLSGVLKMRTHHQQPTQQGNQGRPNPKADKNPQDAQQDTTPNKPAKSDSPVTTQYHDGRDIDPSKV